MLLSELRHQLPGILNVSASRDGDESETSSQAPTMESLPSSASIARVRAKGRDARAEGGADARHVQFDTFLLDHQHDDKTFLELGRFRAEGLALSLGCLFDYVQRDRTKYLDLNH